MDFHPRAHNCWNGARGPQYNLPVNELSSESCDLSLYMKRVFLSNRYHQRCYLAVKAKVNKSDTIGNGFSESNFEL